MERLHGYALPLRANSDQVADANGDGVAEVGGKGMIEITSKADLNRALANALHPEPPASERRAIHESGVWRWVKPQAGIGGAVVRFSGWEPADFCGDPCASKLLRDRMRALNFCYRLTCQKSRYSVAIVESATGYGEFHGLFGELITFALAALRALGVEFELCEGWDAR